MNIRLKQLRNALKLSQEEFGRRLGVTGPGISKIEKGDRGFTEQMILAVCREFNVSEIWLRTGNGQMLLETRGNLIDRMMSENNSFTDRHKELIQLFLDMPSEEQELLMDFGKMLTARHRKKV